MNIKVAAFTVSEKSSNIYEQTYYIVLNQCSAAEYITTAAFVLQPVPRAVQDFWKGVGFTLLSHFS